MKIMTVNSKIKYKCKTMLGVIRNFIIYFVTAYMRKYTCNISTGTAQNTLYIAWRSKQKMFYDKQFATVTI